MQSGLIFASYIFLLSFIGDIFNLQNYFFTLIISCVLSAWSLVAQLVKNLPAMGETWVQSLGWEDPLEKGKATHSVFWPGEFHGLYSPWGHKELDTTERLSHAGWGGWNGGQRSNLAQGQHGLLDPEFRTHYPLP